MLRNATVAGKAGMGVPSEGRWTPCFETPLSPAKPAWGYRPKGGGPHASKRHCRRQSRRPVHLQKRISYFLLYGLKSTLQRWRRRKSMNRL